MDGPSLRMSLDQAAMHFTVPGSYKPLCGTLLAKTLSESVYHVTCIGCLQKLASAGAEAARRLKPTTKLKPHPKGIKE